jgi:hypothetical protein
MGYKFSRFLIIPLRSFSVIPDFIRHESNLNMPEGKNKPVEYKYSC